MAPALGSGNGAEGVDVTAKKKKRSNKKQKDKKVAMEGVMFGPELPPPAVGVPEVVPATVAASTLSPGAAEFVPGKATRVLAHKTSRERSPRGAHAPASASTSVSSTRVPASATVGTTPFAEGTAVMLVDLVSRSDLVGKRGVVKSFDSGSSRYAVCIDASGETVRVLEVNLWASIFVPGGGFG